MKSKFILRGFNKLPRYFRQLCRENTSDFTGYPSRLCWREVLAIWWAIEWRPREQSRHKGEDKKKRYRSVLVGIGNLKKEVKQ